MLKINNKERVIEEMNENKIENIFNIIPNLSDKVLDYVEEKYAISKLINETFESKNTYKTDITPALLLLSGVQARMKQQFSISEVPLALTSQNVIENLGVNINYDVNDGLLKESNIRAILKKYEQEDKNQIEFNNYFVNFFNEFMRKFLRDCNIIPNIHILDCSILDVNLDNSNYEGSSVTYKGGKKLRGYKIGSLRGVTENGGIIEEVCMSTARDHDFGMSEDMIRNSSHLKFGDFLLEDRGFIDIELFKFLNKKGVFVIVPARKSMDIYEEAIQQAKQKNNWQKHPNSKRKGQDIMLVTDLEMAWLSESDKSKKPSKLELDYKINCCVIRFDKEENKDVLTDDEILSTDEKYAYACIITNNINISCAEIIRLYEMRPEIEEDFRQLKDFWGLNTYKSTQYHIISFVILVSLLGYNFYKVYTESEEGQKYIGKSLIVEEKHGLYIVKGVRTAVVTKHYFAMFEQDELLDLYAELDKEKRVLIKQYLTL
ncbi:MAG: transposase [Bacilli bacterium]